jgi:hypothetical protein
MNRLVTAVVVFLFPVVASAAGPTCVPECAGGNAAHCCVWQYRNGTFGRPLCFANGCYTLQANEKLPQPGAKLLPASKVPPTKPAVTPTP